MFFKIIAFKNLENFIGKHLCWSLFFIKACSFIKKRPQHSCFPMKFAKILRKFFLTERLRWLLLYITDRKKAHENWRHYDKIEQEPKERNLCGECVPANICWSWRRLQDMSWRRLQHVFSVTILCLPRRLEDVLKTSWKTKNCYAEDILKTCLEDVLKTSWRCLEDISWRRLEDFKEINKILNGDICILIWG